MSDAELQRARQLVDALRNPACYPHPVRSVELCETHISWVLLTGEYAYKIKKPVKLSFLDFSTLELRRHFCEEELRLNKRFAPSLYLAVVPISEINGTPLLADNQNVREYALRLRQFSRDEELIELLRSEAVTTRDFAHLGYLLAGIHEDAERADPETGFGSAKETMQSVVSTLDDLDRLAAKECKPLLARLRSRSIALGEAATHVMDSRLTCGFVRECHGDLHAGNIVRIDGALTPFDCIEFDPALRWIDVMNDTAFLVADLTARGHRDFAYTFLNAWLERSGDYEAVALLRYLTAYRAMVRAKIGLLANSAAAGNVAPGTYKYLELAEALAEPKRPRLVLTCGLSGSGKTWLSALLLASMPAIRIRSDVERKRLAGLSADESSASQPGSGIYTLEFNERTYARLRQLAAIALRAGEDTIVDAAFLRHAERMDFLALARECNAEPLIVHCTAPRKVLEQRILDRARGRRDASEATLEVLNRQYGYWEPFEETERSQVAEVDTGDPHAVDALASRLRGPAP